MHRSSNYVACLEQVRDALGFFPEEELDNKIRDTMPRDIAHVVKTLPGVLVAIGVLNGQPLTKRMSAFALVEGADALEPDERAMILPLLGRDDTIDRLVWLADQAVIEGVVSRTSYDPDVLPELVHRVTELECVP